MHWVFSKYGYLMKQFLSFRDSTQQVKTEVLHGTGGSRFLLLDQALNCPQLLIPATSPISLKIFLHRPFSGQSHHWTEAQFKSSVTNSFPGNQWRAWRSLYRGLWTPGSIFRAETEVGMKFSTTGPGWDANPWTSQMEASKSLTCIMQLPCALTSKYLAALWLPPQEVLLKWKLKEVLG